MLGTTCCRAGERAGHELVGVDLPELDITDAAGRGCRASRAMRPDAMRQLRRLDRRGRRREPPRGRLMRSTSTAPRNLARGRRRAARAPLLHVSTDYVFDGQRPADAAGRPRPYVESDPTGPRSVYGQTKLAGEREVLAASPRHTVVRSAWLFGLGGRNFADTMLTLPASATPCRWSTTRSAARRGPAISRRRAARAARARRRGPRAPGGRRRRLVERLRRRDLPPGGGELPCRGGDDASRWRALRPGPACSVLESERDDVLPLPPWQDGLAGYLAARAGMMRA